MKRLITLAIASTALMYLPAHAQNGSSFEGAARDAWLVGKVEMAFTLNEHLNPFAIDTDADNGVVTLSGTVESDIDRDLAVAIAEGIDGVTKVNNELQVDSKTASKDKESAHSRNWFTDATTTAAVKTRLVANGSIDALAIDVDTEQAVVTLSGRVRSDAEKELATEVAKKTTNVADVRNLLVVDKRS